MSINVRYFASLKDRVGHAEDQLSCAYPLTVLDVWRRSNPHLPVPDNTLAAVNMGYVGFDSLVNDGDEVAFFPPVTGG